MRKFFVISAILILAICSLYAADGAKSAPDEAEALYQQANEYRKSRDYDSAFKLYLEAANKGHAPSQTMLAKCYILGRGVEQDYKKGLAWAEKAAKRDDPGAFVVLGVASYHGQGLPQDSRF